MRGISNTVSVLSPRIAPRDVRQPQTSKIKDAVRLTRSLMPAAMLTPAECAVAKLTLVLLLGCCGGFATRRRRRGGGHEGHVGGWHRNCVLKLW